MLVERAILNRGWPGTWESKEKWKLGKFKYTERGKVDFMLDCCYCKFLNLRRLYISNGTFWDPSQV